MINIHALAPTIRILAGCSWLAVAVGSLAPVRTAGGWPKLALAVHFVGYALAAYVTRLVFQHTHSRLQITAWAAAAAVFELCQKRIPQRSASGWHWAAATVGAAIGVIMAKRLLEPGSLPF